MPRHDPTKLDVVRWIGHRPPESEEERAAYEAIVARGLTDATGVTECVADILYRHDFDRGGWLVDIGLFRSLYLAEARKVLERLRGRLIHLA